MWIGPSPTKIWMISSTNHPFVDGIFLNHPAIGVPHVWKPPRVVNLFDKSLHNHWEVGWFSVAACLRYGHAFHRQFGKCYLQHDGIQSLARALKPQVLLSLNVFELSTALAVQNRLFVRRFKLTPSAFPRYFYAHRAGPLGVFAPLVMFSVGFKVITMHPEARDSIGLQTSKPKPSVGL